MKNVMVPEELFGKLLKYHLLDQKQEEDDIKKAATEEEREKYRQEYLEKKGIPESFRW